MSVKDQLQRGLLENQEVTIEMDDPRQQFNNESGMLGQMGIDLNDLGSMMPKRTGLKRTLPVKEAREVFIREESEKLVDSADIGAAAIKRAEIQGLFSLMKLIKLHQRASKIAVKFHVKGSNGTSYRSLKVHKLKRNTGLSKPIIFCLLVREHSQKANQVI